MHDQAFATFYCSCDPDLDPMTFIYELDPYSLEYTGCANMKFHVKALES